MMRNLFLIFIFTSISWQVFSQQNAEIVNFFGTQKNYEVNKCWVARSGGWGTAVYPPQTYVQVNNVGTKVQITSNYVVNQILNTTAVLECHFDIQSKINSGYDSKGNYNFMEYNAICYFWSEDINGIQENKKATIRFMKFQDDNAKAITIIIPESNKSVMIKF